jgi:hypothetical protein
VVQASSLEAATNEALADAPCKQPPQQQEQQQVQGGQQEKSVAQPPQQQGQQQQEHVQDAPPQQDQEPAQQATEQAPAGGACTAAADGGSTASSVTFSVCVGEVVWVVSKSNPPWPALVVTSEEATDFSIPAGQARIPQVQQAREGGVCVCVVC